MHTIINNNKSSTMLLIPPPITNNNFTKAVPNLVNFFEGLDTSTEEQYLSSPTSAITPIDMSRIPPPAFPTPFTALRLSLTTSFNHPKRANTTDPTTTSSSASSSPQSSLRGHPFTNPCRSRTWTSTRNNSRSRSYSPHNNTSTPILLTRRPSATDLALLEEEALSHQSRGIGLGLGMMEPRPVVPVAVVVSAASAASSIFEGIEEEGEAELLLEARQPFVMGGILEVMEGRS